MKKKNVRDLLATVSFAALSLTSYNGYTQLGGVKVKNPLEGKGTKTESTTTTETTTTSTGTTDSKSGGSSSKSISVTTPTLVMSNTLGGTTAVTDFKANDQIYVRFAFPKPVGDYFAETCGLSDVPSTGSYALAIGKNADDENPIVILTGDIFTSRYTEDNMLDWVLQGNMDLWNKLERPDADLESKYSFNSIQTMANQGLSTMWLDNALFFKNQTYSWEMFLYFMPWQNEDPNQIKLVAQGKFNYTMSAESKKELVSNLNFYDKQRFEKLPDDGVVTSVHKAHINKFAFSTQKMLKDFDDAGALKTSFDNLSSGIYARLYLNESMRNYMANFGRGKDVAGASYSLYFYVDGETEYRCFEDSELAKEEAFNMTSWSVPLAPTNQEDFEYDVECVNRFAYVISELTAGKHTITVKAIWHPGPGRDTGEEIASGQFSINIALPDRDAFVKKYGLQLPAKGLLEDAKLYAEVKKLAGPNAIDVRCPNVWEERYDAWGQITHRVTIVCYSYKAEDGRCNQGAFMIKQPYSGGSYGATSETVEEGLWYGVDNYLPFQNSK